MRILPVLDLKQGVVVRGVGGRRDEYQPVKSCLTQSAAPLEVARAFRDHFDFNELYLADLDAIAGQEPTLAVYVELLKRGFHPWVDAGIGASFHHLNLLREVGIQNLIAGLESLAGPQQLAEALQQFSAEKIVFSLDLKEGKPLGSRDFWNSSEAWIIAQQAVHLGVKRLLVLDLAGVGSDQGTRTDELCERLRAQFSHLEISTGGGIRGIDDLRRLQKQGVDYVLVASALHDGRLTRKEMETALGPVDKS